MGRLCWGMGTRWGWGALRTYPIGFGVRRVFRSLSWATASVAGMSGNSHTLEIENPLALKARIWALKRKVRKRSSPDTWRRSSHLPYRSWVLHQIKILTRLGGKLWSQCSWGRWHKWDKWISGLWGRTSRGIPGGRCSTPSDCVVSD